MSLSIEVTFVTTERIHLRLLNPDGFNIAKVLRQDANGTFTVRTITGLLPSTAAAIDVDDFEYSLAGRDVVYSVYDTGNVLRGTVSVPTNQFPHSLFITVPLDPSSGIELAKDGNTLANTSMVVDFDSNRASQSTVHEILGRADPVVVLRGGRLQRGNMRFICPDHVRAEELTNVLSLARVFQLRQTDVAGMDLYFVIESVGKRGSADSKTWEVSAVFAEVSWPNGPYTPVTVWTYADVAAAYPDYNALSVAFVDYLALLEKNPIP